MAKFDRNLVEERKKKLDAELLRAGPIHESPMRKERATSLLPGAKSVVVMGKEIFGEVLALLRLSKGAGEAEADKPAGDAESFG